MHKSFRYPPATSMTETVAFRLNDQPVQVRVATDRTLLWVLRTELGITGPKYGCGISQCGACTVLVDHRPVRACNAPIKSVAGKDVVTIEGLAQGGALHPIQQAFIQHDALQCGFCTSGMLLVAHALLKNNPQPSRADIVDAISGNICRCTGYGQIVEAIELAAQRLARSNTAETERAS